MQATIFPPGSAGGSEAWQTGDWDTTAWFAFQVGGRPWTATRGQTFAESEGCSAGCTDGQSGCGSWARMGECDANPSWMSTRCSHSCNTCWSDAECREQVPGSSYRYFPGDSTQTTYAFNWTAPVTATFLMEVASNCDVPWYADVGGNLDRSCSSNMICA